MKLEERKAYIERKIEELESRVKQLEMWRHQEQLRYEDRKPQNKA